MSQSPHRTKTFKTVLFNALTVGLLIPELLRAKEREKVVSVGFSSSTDHIRLLTADESVKVAEKIGLDTPPDTACLKSLAYDFKNGVYNVRANAAFMKHPNAPFIIAALRDHLLTKDKCDLLLAGPSEHDCSYIGVDATRLTNVTASANITQTTLISGVGIIGAHGKDLVFQAIDDLRNQEDFIEGWMPALRTKTGEIIGVPSRIRNLKAVPLRTTDSQLETADLSALANGGSGKLIGEPSKSPFSFLGLVNTETAFVEQESGGMSTQYLVPLKDVQELARFVHPSA